jgi:uncharacterized protein YdeI (YjbR/CyaY-like superfamily)
MLNRRHPLAEKKPDTAEPTFFATPDAFRSWLEAHHATEQELLVGYYKKGSGIPSMTWPESVDQALCFGWIDGVRRGRDDTSYTIRFTPRKRRSIWSAVNIERFGQLAELGLVHPAGHKAFEARADERSAVYAYEQRDNATLDAAAEQQFRDNARAWEFFQAQPAGYRKTAIWWVISAKKEETRSKRLATLIDDSAQRRTIAPLTRRTKPE